MIQAVIFDMDGLLVDSEPVWFESRRELFARFGKIWTDSDQERLMGARTSVWVDYVKEKLEGALVPEEVQDNIIAFMAETYERGDVPILPGAREALEHCAREYRVGLASGSPRQLINAALKGANWFRFFEEVVSSDECARGKPDPEVYLDIMGRMSLNPETTAVVEDSVAGILAGKAAKTKVVGIPRGFTSLEDDALGQADVLLESLLELPNALREL